jgi:hypothetical protein
VELQDFEDVAILVRSLVFAVPPEILSSTERRIVMIGVQIVAGVLAVCVLGIIVYRRKQKAV